MAEHGTLIGCAAIAGRRALIGWAAIARLGAPIAGRRAARDRQDRRHPPPLGARRHLADCVDAAMDSVQPARPAPFEYRLVTQPRLAELMN
jgi:hypothetical protein